MAVRLLSRVSEQTCCALRRQMIIDPAGMFWPYNVESRPAMLYSKCMQRVVRRQVRQRFVAAVFGWTILVFWAAGCSRQPAPVVPTLMPTADSRLVAAIQVTAASSATPAAPAMPTASNSATATPQATPTPLPTATATLTPTPTATPTHPLMIEVMRAQSYPGSELTFERTLAPGSNYHRYLASYLSEGNKIDALLTVPWGETPPTGWPVVIFNHGYIPPAEYRTTERYIAYMDGFARNGYILFRSDYRGHGSSEGEATGAYSSPAYTVDVLNGVAAVKTLAVADAARIGMWGHSMGGYITLRAMVVSADIQAGVIWAGVVGPYPDLFVRQNLPAAGGLVTPTRVAPGGRGWWRQSLLETYGSPEENPAFWASISSSSYLAQLSGPLQLHHGTADSSVPVAASQLLQSQMEAAGMPSELYLYEGDNHNLSAYFNTAMQRSIAFFDTYVKNR